MTPIATKITIIIIAALLATLVAVITSWLKASTGSSIQAAVLTGGAAFGGTMTLALLTMNMTGTLP